MRLLFPLALLALVGCAPAGISVPDTTEVPAGPVVMDAADNENLHTVLWTQTAVEYRAITLQTYASARRMLDAALADPGWTAAPEQAGQAGFEMLPPAVVLDVDETVLDNAAYQARLVRDDALFDSESWAVWAEERAASAVPGALAFTRAADSLGVAVVYLTNRRGVEEAATRDNLAALGFPLAEAYDAVLTRADLTSGTARFDTSDKGPRRLAAAERFRVLALFGDSLSDFLSGADGSVAERDAAAAPYAGWWGERWFMLPNPQYGAWESALFNGDYSLSREERLARKAARLKTGSTPQP